MSVIQLEKRLVKLEQEIKQLKAAAQTLKANRWWIDQAGQFKDDPVYAEIVRRGRKYRESLRPKSRKKSK